MKPQLENFIPTTHQEMAEVPQVSSADDKAEETFALINLFFFEVETGAVDFMFGQFNI